MTEQRRDFDALTQYAQEAGFEAAELLPIIPLPNLVSGLYVASAVRLPVPLPIPRPLPRPLPLQPIPTGPGGASEFAEVAEIAGLDEALSPIPIPFLREELRLDVDGRYPQMCASGVIRSNAATRLHWVARLQPAGPNTWTGAIFYKDGNTALLPQTTVRIQAVRSFFPHQRRATVTFSGGGATRVRTYEFTSPYFHKVELEVDCASDITAADAVTSMQTHAHPNRPATLPNETLTIETVFRRAGFDVTRNTGNTVPITGAGGNARWSDMEMHDAMQIYWSKFANMAQWSTWIFLANLHESGTGLGGIMFDDIGPNHRQGTAVFENAFIKNAPAGDPNPAAWVQRMRFWTCVHETGHSFNLAHSWQKSLGTPWIPLANEPEARSFMNYPYNVQGGQQAFFADFAFRFSDPELLFMRHAPERFVQMGNAAWFDHHGFRQANCSPNPAFSLEIKTRRKSPVYEFLEPVMVELKLCNISTQTQILPDNILSNRDNLTVIVKREGKPARELLPLAHYCTQMNAEALAPGAAKYEPLFAACGVNGFEIAEPGIYTLQVALHMGDEDIVSNPLRIRIAAPASNDEQRVAQDFFNTDVARVLTFDGSRSDMFEGAMTTLREVADQFDDRRVAMHARVALACAASQSYKRLAIKGECDERCAAQAMGAKFEVEGPKLQEARDEFSGALTGKLSESSESAETLGHIEYRAYNDAFSEMLYEQGESEEAYKVQDNLLKTLEARDVTLPSVLDAVRAKRDSYAKRRAAGR